MSGSLFSRTVFILGLAIMVSAVSGLGVAAVDAREKDERSTKVLLPNAVGVALDKRGNLYTADGKSGYVYCVPPDSQPVLLAKVEGKPTALTVDRLRNVFVGTEAGSVFMVSLDGSVSEVFNCCGSPVGLEIDRDGGLIVVMETGVVLRVDREKMENR